MADDKVFGLPGNSIDALVNLLNYAPNAAPQPWDQTQPQQDAPPPVGPLANPAPYQAPAAPAGPVANPAPSQAPDAAAPAGPVNPSVQRALEVAQALGIPQSQGLPSGQQDYYDVSASQFGAPQMAAGAGAGPNVRQPLPQHKENQTIKWIALLSTLMGGPGAQVANAYFDGQRAHDLRNRADQEGETAYNQSQLDAQGARAESYYKALSAIDPATQEARVKALTPDQEALYGVKKSAFYDSSGKFIPVTPQKADSMSEDVRNQNTARMRLHQLTPADQQATHDAYAGKPAEFERTYGEPWSGWSPSQTQKDVNATNHEGAVETHLKNKDAAAQKTLEELQSWHKLTSHDRALNRAEAVRNHDLQNGYKYDYLDSLDRHMKLQAQIAALSRGERHQEFMAKWGPGAAAANEKFLVQILAKRASLAKAMAAYDKNTDADGFPIQPASQTWAVDAYGQLKDADANLQKMEDAILAGPAKKTVQSLRQGTLPPMPAYPGMTLPPLGGAPLAPPLPQDQMLGVNTPAEETPPPPTKPIEQMNLQEAMAYKKTLTAWQRAHPKSSKKGRK